MSKRTIFAENIGDGKFIQVESKKGGSCPEYPIIENEIARIQAMLPARGASAPGTFSAASKFDCPSYAQLMHRLSRLKFKLWLQQIIVLGRNLGGTTKKGGIKRPDWIDYAFYRSNEWAAISGAMSGNPFTAITIAKGIADRIRPIDPGKPGPDQ